MEGGPLLSVGLGGGLTSSMTPLMGTSLSELELSELSAFLRFFWADLFGGGFLLSAPPGTVCGSFSGGNAGDSSPAEAKGKDDKDGCVYVAHEHMSV